MDKDQTTQDETYTEPKLEEWGTVADLTQTGLTRPGTDAKGGSAASQGG
ncbi:hypothetical protein BH20CHL7_BH20CHL7_03410 [soil metagenome]